MKKNITIIIIVFLVLMAISFMFFKENIRNKNGKDDEFSYTPLMYQLCDDDSCIYLLGSIHLGDSRVTKFNNVILDAYNQSDSLAVELDMSSVSFDVNEFVSDTSIENIISKDLNDKLINFSTNHPLFSYESLKYAKLGYLYDYLSLLPYLELGYIQEGVDSYFVSLAHKQKKEVISLETYEEQLSLLLDYSNDFYAKQMEKIINDYDSFKELSISLYDAYLKGNKNELKKLIDEDNENLETEEKMNYLKAVYDDRNIYMASRVEEFLNNNNKVFMVVGSAHVIGNNGIIDLIGNKYKINIVK